MLCPFASLLDIDECAMGLDYDCVDNSYCTDNNGSYTCTCSSGFIGDGTINCSSKFSFCDSKDITLCSSI